MIECLLFQNSFKLGGKNDAGSHGRIIEYIVQHLSVLMTSGCCFCCILSCNMGFLCRIPP
jgi:hypothetical protein